MTTDSSSPFKGLAARIRRQKKTIQESSQGAYATFENGADPSGPDRGLKSSSRRQTAQRLPVDPGCCDAH